MTQLNNHPFTELRAPGVRYEGLNTHQDTTQHRRKPQGKDKQEYLQEELLYSYYNQYKNCDHTLTNWVHNELHPEGTNYFYDIWHIGKCKSLHKYLDFGCLV